MPDAHRDVEVEVAISAEDPGWLHMRVSLWPDTAPEAHLSEMADMLAKPDRYAAFLARDPAGTTLGFAEVSLRTEYVNGTSSSPVAFLEGLYVIPDARMRGAARSLVAAGATWGRAQGCTEFASDTAIENRLSRKVHARLGFVETERVVYFTRQLGPQHD